ncbi:MAG: FxLYD domain-containing protein [Candidatus Bathyarchaeota archaeon]|nr:FxLYD domain-containing protein [Candidatus Bathyarchaeota archaeon]
MRLRCHILWSLLLLAIIASNIYPANALGEVVILDNHSSYIALSGALHVVGEVNNTGETNVKNIIISVTYFDIDDRAIASGSSSVLQEILLPRMKAPFDAVLTGSSVVQQVDRYELEVSFSETDIVLNRTLLVQSYSFLSNITGSFVVIVEVKNSGTEISNATNAVTTCYDSSGTVVAAKQSDLMNLNRGETGYFVIIIDEPQGTKVTSYEVSAISSDAIIIPEFSSILMILLIGCLLAFAISRMKKDLSHSIIRTR